jgi:hypothetical protein
MYILEITYRIGEVGNMDIFHTRAEAVPLFEAWKSIGETTLRRVTKSVALHEYAKYLIEALRQDKERCGNEPVGVALNHTLCRMFRLRDATEEGV